MSDPDKDAETQAHQNAGEQAADSEQAQVASSVIPDNDGEKPMKRGRGRPKGSKNKPREGATAAAPASPEGPKRKRGRPPKEKPTPTSNPEEGDDQPATKRPRGRPRKNPLPASGINASAVSTTAVPAGEGIALDVAAAAGHPKDDDANKTGDNDAEGEVAPTSATAAPTSTGSAGKKRGRPPKSTS